MEVKDQLWVKPARPKCQKDPRKESRLLRLKPLLKMENLADSDLWIISLNLNWITFNYMKILIFIY